MQSDLGSDSVLSFFSRAERKHGERGSLGQEGTQGGALSEPSLWWGGEGGREPQMGGGALGTRAGRGSVDQSGGPAAAAVSGWEGVWASPTSASS